MEKWTTTSRKPPKPAPRLRTELLGKRIQRGPLSARVVAVVGHEIRSPLAAALVYMNIAERSIYPGNPGTPARNALATARAEILRVERLVGRVMELEQYGHPVLRPVFIDAVEVVRGTIARATLGETATRVVLSCGHEDMSDWWDEDALEQMAHNLISNALKFGQGRPVQVSMGRTSTGLRLVVQDQGRGISATDRDRIFKKRVRAPAHRSGGLGLGLWLVQQLATAHGGKVAVYTRPSKGSTFTVTVRPMPLPTTDAALRVDSALPPVAGEPAVARAIALS
jgi:signal transduction histidine kinase